jgi:hypothetical protein
MYVDLRAHTHSHTHTQRNPTSLPASPAPSLGALLPALLTYYADDFPYDTAVISVATGGLLTKEEKGWGGVGASANTAQNTDANPTNANTGANANAGCTRNGNGNGNGTRGEKALLSIECPVNRDKDVSKGTGRIAAVREVLREAGRALALALADEGNGGGSVLGRIVQVSENVSGYLSFFRIS